MLPKKNRLTKDRDFKRVYKNVSKTKGTFLSIRYNANNRNNSRFGIIVSNKAISRAVKRNLVKRRLRQALRGYLDKIKSGYDVILKLERMPHGAILKNLKADDFSLELDKLFERSNLFK